MKIPGSNTPIQPFQPQTASSRPAQSDTADSSARFGAARALHPENPAVGPSSELLSKFRDPASLADRANNRAEGLNHLKHEVARQFGSDMASRIFNDQSTGGQAGLMQHGGGDFQSFKTDF